jgi:hypothetical protein
MPCVSYACGAALRGARRYACMHACMHALIVFIDTCYITSLLYLRIPNSVNLLLKCSLLLQIHPQNENQNRNFPPNCTYRN